MLNNDNWFKATYKRLTTVGTWDNITEATHFVGLIVFVYNIVLSLVLYILTCAFTDLKFFTGVSKMPPEQKAIFFFMIANVVISTIAFTVLIVKIYDKIINKPVHELTEKLNKIGSGDDDNYNYLVSGKLSRPFQDSSADKTWMDKVQDYVDTASAEKYIDELTGCFNRKYFSQIAAPTMRTRLLTNSIGSGPKTYNTEIYAVFLIDIDHFKLVNDDFGHASGDEVLKQVGYYTKKIVGDAGFVIRNGGEEFLLIVSAKYPYDFAELAEEINETFRRHISITSQATGETRQITCSVGFVEYPLYDFREVNLSLQNHVDLADQAMYMSKMNGRNTWRQIVAARTPSPKTDLDLLCCDPNYGINNGYIDVRLPEGSDK